MWFVQNQVYDCTMHFIMHWHRNCLLAIIVTFCHLRWSLRHWRSAFKIYKNAFVAGLHPGPCEANNITQLSSSFHQLHSVHSPPGSPHPAHITSSQSPTSLLPSITPFVFHSRLKTHLFHKFLPPLLFLRPDCLHGPWTCTELSGHWRFVLVSSFFIFFFWLRVLD